MNLHVRTPTEAAAVERRRKFHADIAAKAAALASPQKANATTPESFPAETDPPIMPSSFSELLARRAAVLKKLDQVDETIARAVFPPIALIQRIVAARYQLSRKDMLSTLRTSDVSTARQIAMYIARQVTPLSSLKIGRAFGNRDHTTVLHAINKINRLKASSPELVAEIEALTAEVLK
jgi:hypothetical protein